MRTCQAHAGGGGRGPPGGIPTLVYTFVHRSGFCKGLVYTNMYTHVSYPQSYPQFVNFYVFTFYIVKQWWYNVLQSKGETAQYAVDKFGDAFPMYCTM